MNFIFKSVMSTHSNDTNFTIITPFCYQLVSEHTSGSESCDLCGLKNHLSINLVKNTNLISAHAAIYAAGMAHQTNSVCIPNS